MGDDERALGGYSPEAGRNAHEAEAPTLIPVPSLLRALLSEHLDPGYAAAAARRADGKARGRWSDWSWQLLAGGAVAAVFATAAAQAQTVAPATRETQHVLAGRGAFSRRRHGPCHGPTQRAGVHGRSGTAQPARGRRTGEGTAGQARRRRVRRGSDAGSGPRVDRDRDRTRRRPRPHRRVQAARRGQPAGDPGPRSAVGGQRAVGQRRGGRRRRWGEDRAQRDDQAGRWRNPGRQSTHHQSVRRARRSGHRTECTTCSTTVPRCSGFGSWRPRTGSGSTSARATG